MPSTGLLFEARNAAEYEATLDRLEAIIQRLNRTARQGADAFEVFERSFLFSNREPILRTTQQLERLDRALQNLGDTRPLARGLDSSLRRAFSDAFNTINESLGRLDIENRLRRQGQEAGVAFAQGFRSRSGDNDIGRTIARELDGVPPQARSVGVRAGAQFADGFSTQISNVGTVIRTQLLQDFDQFISGPIRRLLQDTISAAIDFQSELAGVAKTIDFDETFTLDALEEQIRALAVSDSPLGGLENSQAAIARILEQAGQLGIGQNLADAAARTEALLQFASVSGQLLLSTDLTLESGIVELAQFSNIVQTATADYDNLASTLVDLGNKSAATEAEIVRFAQRLAGAANQAGISQQGILGLSAALASLGLNPEASGTAITQFLSRVTAAIAEGGDKLDGFAALTGRSVDEFRTLFETDALGAIVAFSEGLSGLSNTEAVQVLESLGLDGVRLSDVLRRLGSNTELFTDLLVISNEAWEANNALTTEAEKRYATTQSQLNRLGNNLRELAITIGETFFDFINGSVDALVPFIQALSNLDPALLRFGAILAGVVAAAGPVAIVLNQISIALAAIRSGAVAANFAPFFAPLLNVLLPLAAVLGTIAVAFELIRQSVSPADFERFTQAMRDLAGAVGDLFGAGFGLIGTLIDRILTVITGVLGINTAFDSTRASIAGFVNGITSSIDGLLIKIRELTDFLNFINLALGGTPPIAPTPGENAALTRQNLLLQRREALLARQQELLAAGNFQDFTVSQGDTLSAIAARFGVSVQDIANANGIADVNRIFAGQVLQIPIGIDSAELDAVNEQIRQTELEAFRAGEAAVTNAQQAIGTLESLFDRVSQTDIFKQFFGDAASLEDVRAKLANIDLIAAQAADSIERFVNSFKNEDGNFTLQSVIDGLAGAVESLDLAALSGALIDKLNELDISAIIKRVFQLGDTSLGATLIDQIIADISNIDTSRLSSAISGAFSDLNLGGIAAALGDAIRRAIGGGSLVQNAGIPGLGDLSSQDGGLFDSIVTALAGIPDLVKIAIGVVFPPAGLVLGIGSALASAIENDLFGLRTLLEESGISDAINTALDFIKELFDGDSENGLPDVDTSGITDFIDDISQTIQDIADAIGPEVRESLSQIGTGISGFLEGISGRDTSNLQTLAANLLKIGGAIAGIAGAIIAVGLDLVTDVFEVVLPAVGNTLGELVEVLNSLAAGDVTGALGNLGDAIAEFASGIFELPTTVAQTIGSYLPNLFDIIKAELDRLLIELNLALLRVIDDLGIDVDSQIYALEQELAQGDTTRGIAAALQNSINANEPLDLSQLISTGDGFSQALGDLLSDTSFLDTISLAGKQSIEDALIAAIGRGDTEAIEVLVPLALDPRVENDADVSTRIKDELIRAITSGDSGALSLLLPIALDPTIAGDVNPGEVIAQRLVDAIYLEDQATIDLLLPVAVDPRYDFGEEVSVQLLTELESAIQLGDQETIDLLVQAAPQFGLDLGTEPLDAAQVADLRTRIQAQIARELSFASGEGPLVALTSDTDVNPVRITAEGLGISFTDGIVAGIANGRGDVQAETQALADDDMKGTLEEALETGSPSKWAKRLGEDFVEGLFIGLSDNRFKIQEILRLFVEDFELFAEDVQRIANKIGTIFNTLPAKVAPGISGISSQLTVLGNQFNLLALRAAAAEAAIRRALAVGPVPTAGGGNGQDIGLNPGGGGRAQGGPVFAGELYEVAERGISELLRMGDRTFLIPGQNGTVIPPTPVPSVSPFAALPFAQAPTPSFAGGGSSVVINESFGDIIVNAAPGQDPQQIARAVRAEIDAANRANPIDRRLVNQGRL